MSNFKRKVQERYELPFKIDNEYIKYLISQRGNDIERIWQLCFRDLSRNHVFDLSPRILAKSTFSEDTIFPEEFYNLLNISNLLEIAKYNRFGIDLVHESGIRGDGMHIAVFDQGLVPEGKRFNNYNNFFYEHRTYTEDDSMHANAVVDTVYSICPMAKIHFFSEGYKDVVERRLTFLEEIYRNNLNVPPKDRILVISISCSFLYDGYDKKGERTDLKSDYQNLRKKLSDKGCYIVDSEAFGNHFAISSPIFNNDFSKVIDVEYGEEWVKCANNKDYERELFANHILVPGGGRLYAIPSDRTELIYTGSASYSWSIPIVAGMLLLSKSRKRNLSLKDFYNSAFKFCDYNSAGQRVINLHKIIQNL